MFTSYLQNRPLTRTVRRQRPVFVDDVYLPVTCRSSSRVSTRTSSQRTRRGPSIQIHQRASAPKWGGVFVHACPQPPPSSSSQWAKTRTGLSSPCGRGPGGGAPVSQSRTRAATASADRAVYLPSGQCQQPLILARYSPASSFCPVNWAKSYRKIASVLPCFFEQNGGGLVVGIRHGNASFLLSSLRRQPFAFFHFAHPFGNDGEGGFTFFVFFATRDRDKHLVVNNPCG